MHGYEQNSFGTRRDQEQKALNLNKRQDKEKEEQLAILEGLRAEGTREL